MLFDNLLMYFLHSSALFPGIITDVNTQTELLTGCTRDELIGAPFKSYFTDPALAEAGIKRVLIEGKVNYTQVFFLCVCACNFSLSIVCCASYVSLSRK